jgi:hypothetical protein
MWCVLLPSNDKNQRHKQRQIQINAIKRRQGKTPLPIYTAIQQEKSYELLEKNLQDIIQLQGDNNFIQKLYDLFNKATKEMRTRPHHMTHTTRNLLVNHVNWLLKIPQLRMNTWTRLKMPTMKVINIIKSRKNNRRKKSEKQNMETQLHLLQKKQRIEMCMSPHLMAIKTRILLLGRKVKMLINWLDREE